MCARLMIWRWSWAIYCLQMYREVISVSVPDPLRKGLPRLGCIYMPFGGLVRRRVSYVNPDATFTSHKITMVTMMAATASVSGFRETNIAGIMRYSSQKSCNTGCRVGISRRECTIAAIEVTVESQRITAIFPLLPTSPVIHTNLASCNISGRTCRVGGGGGKE
jgi:hypothetical protein